MIDAEYCRAMADYNAWMNDRLYALCAEMTDAERKLDRGAFFRSIHLTLNHILAGDAIILARITDDFSDVPANPREMHGDFAELARARKAMDRRLFDWAAAVTPDWLSQDMTFLSQIDNREHTLPRWLMCVQLFNHQTHHRGQVTTLLSQMGLDIGTTDIPFMPQFVEP